MKLRFAIDHDAFGEKVNQKIWTPQNGDESHRIPIRKQKSPKKKLQNGNSAGDPFGDGESQRFFLVTSNDRGSKGQGG